MCHFQEEALGDTVEFVTSPGPAYPSSQVPEQEPSAVYVLLTHSEHML